MDNSKLNIYFQNLLKMFVNEFDKYKEKRIVLYGIGAFSATVIECLSDYNIVGLMDRDPENIGKILYGVPILSKEQAEKEADIIIINTETNYWQTIYKRIKDVKVDIYYRNGKKAFLEDVKHNENLKYWSKNRGDLLKQIDNCDVVSFDVFDTLITRKIYLPIDVFRLIEAKIKYEMGIEVDFVKLRTKALHSTGIIEPNYDEIYDTFGSISGLDNDIVKKIKILEIEIEKQLLVVRQEVFEILKYSREKGKKIILVSDMYYSSNQIREFLSEVGILNYDEIFVSCEYRKNKNNGALFREVKNVYGDYKILHIGDNITADYESAVSNGINAYYIMSGRDLLANSSMKDIVPHICTLEDSLIIGNIISKLFNNPFALCESRGKVYIDDPKELGYSVFGPLILGFTHWLVKYAIKDRIDKLMFFARDGWFLKDYYNLMQNFCNGTLNTTRAEYFMISRRLAAVSSISDEEDFVEVAKLPYKGTFAQYMEKRWNVKINKNDNWYDKDINVPVGFDEILLHVMNYKDELKDSILKDKKNYLAYCLSMIDDKNIAIVDTWYYGNCQWYLSKILKQSLRGYYFAANLTKDNRNVQYNIIKSCYNKEGDLTGSNLNCLKKSLLFESVFTAPHGMIRSCISKEEFLYEPKGKNQKHFRLREDVDLGVKQFFDDYMKIVGKEILVKKDVKYDFNDILYGEYWDGGLDLAKEIKERLYNENYFQSTEEFMIIE